MANKHATKNWKSITDDKEKYAAYLCSREWAEKREAVRQRSKGTCERCNLLPMEACHHLSYKRKYNESLEDLQAICNPCHEFTHGKSDVDIKKMSSSIVHYFYSCSASGLDPCPLFLLLGSAYELAETRHAASVMAIDALQQYVDQIELFDPDCRYSDITKWIEWKIMRSINSDLPFYYSSLLRWCGHFRNDWLTDGRLQFYQWCVNYFGMKTDETLQRKYGDDDE